MYIVLYGAIFKILEDMKKIHLLAAGNKRLPTVPRKEVLMATAPVTRNKRKRRKEKKKKMIG